MSAYQERQERLWHGGHDSSELEIMADPVMRRTKVAAAIVAAEQRVIANRSDEERQQWLHYIHIVGQSFNNPNKLNVIKAVQRAVCKHYDVSHSDLISDRRTARVVRARQVAMYLAKVLTAKSFPELGRQFGGKDHTTVLHAVNKIGGRLPTDTKLSAEVADIRRKVVGG